MCIRCPTMVLDLPKIHRTINKQYCWCWFIAFLFLLFFCLLNRVFDCETQNSEKIMLYELNCWILASRNWCLSMAECDYLGHDLFERILNFVLKRFSDYKFGAVVLWKLVSICKKMFHFSCLTVFEFSNEF